MQIKTQARQYVAELLKNDQFVLKFVQAPNIFNTKITANAQENLPLINVLISEDAEDKGSTGYNAQHHKTKTAILEIWILIAPSGSSADSAGDLLDEIEEVVKNALYRDQNLNGLVTYCEYMSTKMLVNTDAAYPHAISVVTYHIKYVE